MGPGRTPPGVSLPTTAPCPHQAPPCRWSHSTLWTSCFEPTPLLLSQKVLVRWLELHSILCIFHVILEKLFYLLAYRNLNFMEFHVMPLTLQVESNRFHGHPLSPCPRFCLACSLRSFSHLFCTGNEYVYSVFSALILNSF